MPAAVETDGSHLHQKIEGNSDYPAGLASPPDLLGEPIFITGS